MRPKRSASLNRSSLSLHSLAAEAKFLRFIYVHADL